MTINAGQFADQIMIPTLEMLDREAGIREPGPRPARFALAGARPPIQRGRGAPLRRCAE